MLASLMSTRFVTEKYANPRIPVVTTFINGHPIKNTLIDLGVAINVMTMDNLSHIRSFDLLPTPTMLELAYRSKVDRGGIRRHCHLVRFLRVPYKILCSLA